MTPRRRRTATPDVPRRLREFARERGEDVQRVFVRYGLERLMWRLSVSPASVRVILKGGMLFSAWFDAPHRATRDLDLLVVSPDGRPAILDGAQVREVFQAVCADDLTPDADDLTPDAIEFDADGIEVQPIRAQGRYPSFRLRIPARLGTANLTLWVDVASGDRPRPKPRYTKVPTALDGLPAPRLLAYDATTVVAEKTQAMVDLGLANSRLKAFYDIAFLSAHREFDGPTLVRSLRGVFELRKTPLPRSIPVALSASYRDARETRSWWSGFVRKHEPTWEADWSAVHETVRGFIWPALRAASARDPFIQVWAPGGPWYEPGSPVLGGGL